MDQSDPATPETSVEAPDTSNRRKSGRTRQKPVLLSQDPNVVQNVRAGSAKRKLAQFQDQEEGEPDADEVDDPSNNDDSDPDEEELKERRRKAPRKTAPKQAPKKSKVSASTATSLPVRPAINGVKKNAKPRRADTVKKGLADGGTGLFGE